MLKLTINHANVNNLREEGNDASAAFPLGLGILKNVINKTTIITMGNIWPLLAINNSLWKKETGKEDKLDIDKITETYKYFGRWDGKNQKPKQFIYAQYGLISKIKRCLNVYHTAASLNHINYKK